jgi:restriction endonuclease Mrr
MERLLFEVFQTLGFETELTRSARDGGFDLRLVDERQDVYLVEVKHWATSIGSGPVRRLVEVIAREEAAGGLLLATSGFSPSIFDGRIGVEPSVRLGDGAKIASLCRIFFRADTQLWQPDSGLASLLFEDTQTLISRER